MKWSRFILAASIVAAFAGAMPARVAAQEGTCGGMVAGYAAWASSGPAEAVRLWLEGSSISSGDQLIGVLGQLQGMFGDVRGHEVVRDVTIAPSLRRIYVMALHEAAPSFAYFDCYRTGGRWTITNINLNSDAEDVLPAGAFWPGEG